MLENKVGFEAFRAKHGHFHLQLYRCREPGMRGPDPWICGGFGTNHSNEGMTPVQAGACADPGEISVLYSSANDHDGREVFTFPPGLGMKMGGDTGFNYFVLWTHYPDLSNLTDGWTPHSQMNMRIITRRPDDAAFPLVRNVVNTVFALEGSLPPHSDACVTGSYSPKDTPLSLVAIMTHSHEMTRRFQVWLWHKSGDKQVLFDSNHTVGNESMTVVDPEVPVAEGDRILTRCTYHNPTDNTVVVA